MKRLLLLFGLCVIAMPTAYAIPDATYPFELTTSSTNSFQFKMSAAGTFTVDCGNGGTLTSTANDVTNNNTITRSGVTEATYTCTWTSSSTKIVRFGGHATGYSTTYNVSTIRFNIDDTKTDTNVKKIAGIDGSLGAIFGTVANPTSKPQPRFVKTFYGASNMTGSIPAGLFSGLSGAPTSNMFQWTFFGCTGLTNTNIDDPNNPGKKYAIPPTLFNNVSGAPAGGIFNATFYGCTGLTGTIPGTLFSGLSGAPTIHMFDSTFYGCTNLSGSIPANLFSGIIGAPAPSMFEVTFQHCYRLTGSIPSGLFSGISGAPATQMFWGTFAGCEHLTGAIPANLFSGISGAPAEKMFSGTFSGTTNLSGYIPSTLFGGISTSATATDQMTNIFSGSGIATSCPSGTKQSTTGFESWFGGKVACMDPVTAVAAASYVTGMYESIDNNKIPKLTASSVEYTNDSSPVGIVTSVVGNGDKFMVTRKQVTIPVGAPDNNAQTRAQIWID